MTWILKLLVTCTMLVMGAPAYSSYNCPNMGRTSDPFGFDRFYVRLSYIEDEVVFPLRGERPYDRVVSFAPSFEGGQPRVCAKLKHSKLEILSAGGVYEMDGLDGRIFLREPAARLEITKELAAYFGRTRFRSRNTSSGEKALVGFSEFAISAAAAGILAAELPAAPIIIGAAFVTKPFWFDALKATPRNTKGTVRRETAEMRGILQAGGNIERYYAISQDSSSGIEYIHDILVLRSSGLDKLVLFLYEIKLPIVR